MSTTLTIRNLDDNVKQKLRMLAASHQRSMEAEARVILTLAVTANLPHHQAAVQAIPPLAASACSSVRGLWKSRNMSTDALMALTRGE